jgi:tetratricopeptide (TPR) repeat protein
MRALICGCLGAATAFFVALPALPQSQLISNATPETEVRGTAFTPIGASVSDSRTHSALTTEEAGDVHEFRQEYQAAIDTYSTVDPLTARVWNKMGVAYEMLLDTKDAERSYTQALKIDPNNFAALNNLATLDDSLANFSAAERLCQKAVKLEPHSALALKNLGTTLLLQHDYDKGADAYAQALAIDPHIFESGSTFTAHIAAPSREHGTTDYFQARVCARGGQAACAVSHLRKAFDKGSANVKKVAKESDFDSIRDNPGFHELLAEQK